MSQFRLNATAFARAAHHCLGALAVIVVVLAASGPADARDAKPPKKPPPGVIIEPPAPRGDAEVIRPDDEAPDDQNRQRPGCPANDRKLELIV